MPNLAAWEGELRKFSVAVGFLNHRDGAVNAQFLKAAVELGGWAFVVGAAEMVETYTK